MIDLRVGNQSLDPVFKVVGEFEPLGGEELDAVVVVRIVGGRDHDACVGSETSGQKGDSGSGEGPDQNDIDPH